MKDLGVGIVGTGWVSGEYLKAFKDNRHTEVCGIASRDKARAEEKAREHGLSRCRSYDRLEDLLENLEIHLVVLATPHHLHVPQGISAAKAGKHLIIEKPVALDLAGLRELQAAVRAAGVKTVVSFVLHWNPLFETIRALLADRVVGQIYYAEVDYFHGIGPWYKQYEWNIRKGIGGSSLLTAGCHAVDALRWFVDKRAVEVFAYSNFSSRNPLRYEYEPNSVSVIRFEDGTIGKVASSVECVMPYVFNIELLGDEGAIRNNQVYSKRWVGQKGWATIPTILPDSGDVTHHAFHDEVNHFVDCILNNRESHTNLDDAVPTHEICFASVISSRERRPVPLPL